MFCNVAKRILCDIVRIHSPAPFQNAIWQKAERFLAAILASCLSTHCPMIGCHEALHMASVVQDIVERHVLNHPAIVLNPDWYRRAYHASTELAALYQDIGRASLLDRKP